MQKRVKKYNAGGSVIDTPSRDMRDPKYRKHLERAQALETSVPEMGLPIGRIASGVVRGILRGGTKKGSSQALTKNIEIGENARAVDNALSEGLRKLPASERELMKQKMSTVANKEQVQKENSIAQYAREKALNDVVSSGNRSALFEYLPKIVTSDKETGYKKGGKVSSASNRADGCAIRGKTKGKMV